MIRQSVAPTLRAALLALLAACGSDGAPSDARSITPQSGDDQTGIVGEELAPLVVRVVDASDVPEADVEVGWSVVSGGGDITPASSLTDANGLASTTFTLGPTVGAQVARASVAGADGSPVTFTATALAGPPTQMTESSGDGQAGSVGAQLPLPYVVLIRDESGAPLDGIDVAWEVRSGGGSVSADTTTSDAAGLAKVFHTLGPSAGGQEVSASVQGLTGSPVTFRATGKSPFAILGGGDNVAERYTSDLWVHGEYAYTGTWGFRSKSGNAVKIWHLSPGGAPTLVDSIITANIGTVSDIEVSSDGSLLVFSAENGAGAGLYLYSLADPANPTFMASFPVNTGLHTAAFGYIGGKRYVFAAKNPSSPALIIFEIDPLSVTPIAPVDTLPVAANYGLHDTFVRDGLAFLCAWNSGVLIYDVGNGMNGGSPSSPQFISSIVTSGGKVHNAWWFHGPLGEKKYLFVGEEGPGTIGGSSSGDIHVVDVSNLNTPVEVGSYHLSGAGTHNFWMDEARQILYAAYYNGGVVALDVSGSLGGNLFLREIARITPGGSGNTFVWGVMLANGDVYASDMLSGLWQLKAP